jgi:hypothetical protein
VPDVGEACLLLRRDRAAREAQPLRLFAPQAGSLFRRMEAGVPGVG